MPIKIYIIDLICFSNFYSLLSLLLISIDNQSHRSCEIKPEHTWHSRKASSSTNDYHGQQDKSHCRPDTYNQRQ